MKEKETVETGLKRSRSASLAAATGPQRVPLGPGKAAPAAQVQARVPAARIYRPQVPLPSSRRIPVPEDPPAVPEVVVKHEDEMEVEHHVTDVTAPYVADDAELTEFSDREEDLQLDEAEQSDDEEPVAKRPRVWPEVSTARAQRYRREVEDVKEHFHDDVDEFDTTMVSEYAEDIFEYMQELEVRVVIDSPCPPLLTPGSGGGYAQPRLHDWPDGNRLEYATNLGRLVTSGALALPHAS